MNIKYLSLENGIVFNWFENLIIKSIAELEGKPLKNGKLDYYKHEFFKQYCTHFLSIRTLVPGLSLQYQDRGNEISALASALVLIRASLENYSLFYHIYRNSSNISETHFRFWSWFREGLMYRQRLIVNHYEEKQKMEKHEIDRIMHELQSQPSYQLLTNKQKQRYMKEGKWCFHSRQELLESAGFSKPLSTNCYIYFSSYAHPSSNSHLQTAQADFNDSNKILNNMLKPLFISSGLYVRSYSLMFEEIQSLLNEQDEEFLRTWCELGSELMK